MGGYIPVNEADRQAMLQAVGLETMADLYADIPEAVRLKEGLNLPDGMAEQTVRQKLADLARQNYSYDVVLRGAGSYHHYIPAAVSQIAAKENFVTCYTPYQAEISQGVLQGIFEFQTMIAELTTMDVSNASVYDGATAAGEAMAMSRERKKTKVLCAATANPMTQEVMNTYASGAEAPFERVAEADGRLDLAALKEALEDPEVCALYIESPNYYGLIENMQEIADLVHQAGAKLIFGANPLALAIYESPVAFGADIVVGDGQPLGLPMNYGGPSVGFMATTKKLMRRLPGRIVGETTDEDGNRAYVLTLQAREQHIRRDKASSNICSNQALCALTSAIYMGMMGPEGLREVAMQSRAKAHYLADGLAKIGYDRVHDGAFFHEFVTTTPVPARQVEAALREKHILSGLPLDDNRMLWCATEQVSKETLDQVLDCLKEVAQ
ncbi:aminomethyl-transferring glycine dehydrogenase subunit GcvPA [Peptococcus simiae]|uniref:Probable glycine dehydrogenase (decarboxylating) subunit 1 n=1 Tax=Peptococcus simiae TaxID=1643805 RepID=A0ABW9GZR2_9FIRM